MPFINIYFIMTMITIVTVIALHDVTVTDGETYLYL